MFLPRVKNHLAKMATSDMGSSFSLVRVVNEAYKTLQVIVIGIYFKNPKQMVLIISNF